MEPTASSSSRVLLVTGTSSGIGLSVAVAAAAAGWTTIATLRDTGRAAALEAAATAAGVMVEVLPLDVTDPASVEAAIAAVEERHGRLDALVNNAGAATVGTLETLEVDDFRRAMEVNFFGVVQLTRAAMPLLRASGGRVITVSSVGGIVGQPFNDAYCAAKFAVEGFLESLQPVARTVGVSVSVVEPGAVSTEFVANAKIDPAAALAEAGPYAPALGAYLERTRAAFDPANAQTPDGVARVIVDLLDAEEPPFRVQTSDAARAFVGGKLADLDGSVVTSMTAGWVGA